MTRRLLLATSILANLLFLAYFKYSIFILRIASELFNDEIYAFILKSKLIPSESVLVPLGISFITFQRISYIADIYLRKVKPARNFIDYSVYATIFPHLIAGPIVRYLDVKNEIRKRKIDILIIYDGFRLFTLGLFLKVVIADQLFLIEKVLQDSLSTLNTFESWVLVFLFSLRIYVDFSGYSLMAIGLAKMLGFNAAGTPRL